MAGSTALESETWNSRPFNLERGPGNAPGTVILRFHGPFTLRDANTNLPPVALEKMLDLEPASGEQPPQKSILDLTDCPYVDSWGLGVIVTHQTRCHKKGVRMIVAGIGPRVRHLFELTRMDSVIATASTVDDAEIA
jgi:anti-anti-sigma factor